MLRRKKKGKLDVKIEETWSKVFDIMVEQGMAGVGARQRLRIRQLKAELQEVKDQHSSQWTQAVKEIERERNSKFDAVHMERQRLEKEMEKMKMDWDVKEKELQEELKVQKKCLKMYEKTSAGKDVKNHELRLEAREREKKFQADARKIQEHFDLLKVQVDEVTAELKAKETELLAAKEEIKKL